MGRGHGQSTGPGPAVRPRPAPAEGNPPFVLVVDVGHTFEVYADFSQLGKAYQRFPSAGPHRRKPADLVGRGGWKSSSTS